MRPLPWLAPLVPVYAAALRQKNAAYDRGLPAVNRLVHPVVSVGNLSTGGSGKTPVVIALAKLLMADGLSVDVLSRGYGRTSHQTLLVPASASMDADTYGDEPLMMARSTDARVFVGQSRYEAGMLAERSAPLQHHLHLLDDGFQHRQLARDLDVVVLHPSDLTDRLLPAGHLREPLSSLARAQALVIRDEDRHCVSAAQKYLHVGAQVWYIQRTLTCEARGGPVAAFCGIARPQEFLSGLRAIGIEVAASVLFKDHHRYTEGDVQKIVRTCREAGVAHLVTTEKDAVRLDGHAAAIQKSVTLTVAKLEAKFLDPGAVSSRFGDLLRRDL